MTTTDDIMGAIGSGVAMGITVGVASKALKMIPNTKIRIKKIRIRRKRNRR